MTGIIVVFSLISVYIFLIRNSSISGKLFDDKKYKLLKNYKISTFKGMLKTIRVRII